MYFWELSPSKILSIWGGLVLQKPALLSRNLAAFPSVVVPLDNFFNNKAASVYNLSADFDRRGSSYDGLLLPTGPYTYEGITYDLPTSWGYDADNVLADGQVLYLSNSTYVHELHILYAGDGYSNDNQISSTFTLNYVDKSSREVTLTGKNWWRWPFLNWGIIRTPYHFEQGGAINHNSTHIFQWSTSIPSRSALESIVFPRTLNDENRLHIFAVSVTPAVVPSGEPAGPEVSVRNVRFSQRWEDVNGQRAQSVEVTLANLLPVSSAASLNALLDKVEIEIVGHGIHTVSPGVVYRLMPADQVRVDVLIVNAHEEGNATVRIIHAASSLVYSSSGWPIAPLRESWTTDEAVLSTHETPTWWNKAKYGIFIHWGPYSVPAWGPPWSYAEWYDWSFHGNPHDPANPTWAHHRATYGENAVYDDFIANFTASKWDPSAWLDLFDEAGAKYFVFTTKHHDGYGLFDTKNTSQRSSVHLEPHRDFLRELMDTAKKEKPHLHRGTYFSLPEWFNPDYAKYGFGTWPGGSAHNPYNQSQIDPFIGRLDIDDYLDDLQYPQMLSLALDYESEIMWCDIGGPNKTPEFAAQFYTNAMQQGIQVTLNDRCGAVPDFDTPEYARFGSLYTRHWETSEGMDPNSYGLNTETDASKYKNGTTIIQTLVDIVSKNGNYLLDVGPTAEGVIIPPMVDNLLDAGRWLKHSGDCVYATDYWYQGSQSPDASVRFLTTPTTFCIISFVPPTNGTLIVDPAGAILPIREGDEIRLLRPNLSKDATLSAQKFMEARKGLRWTSDVTGTLIIEVPQEQVDAVQFAWAFQITYFSR